MFKFLKKLLQLTFKGQLVKKEINNSQLIDEKKRKEIEKFKKSIDGRLTNIFNQTPSNTSKVSNHSGFRHQKTNEDKRKPINPINPINPNKSNKLKVEETTLKNNQRTTPLPQQSKVSLFNTELFFKNFGFSQKITDLLTEKKILHPSKVQEKTIPLILEGKNVICSSETGSGKTLAFTIPIIEKLIKNEIHQIIILCPTREIAIQIESVIKQFAEALNFTIGLVIGGLDMLVQKKILRNYPNILIATPGRIVDVLSQGLLWLDYTSLVVMDEVDRMLDMGFEKDISTLFDAFPKSIQCLMFTATLNDQLEKIAKKYIEDYQLVKIGDTMKTKESIEHLFLSTDTKDKYENLQLILRKKRNEKILIFFNSIDGTISTFKKLKKEGFKKIDSLHSKKNQQERNQILNAFREDKINHLLSTDVLARGVDIPNINLVINYDLPYDSEDYIHRIGRTGRADSLGKALSFVDKKNEHKLKKLKQIVKSSQGFNFINQDLLKHF